MQHDCARVANERHFCRQLIARAGFERSAAKLGVEHAIKKGEAPFVAISNEQARLLEGLNVVGTVLHGIDTDSFTFREHAEDYLLFLGRFTDGKGVLQSPAAKLVRLLNEPASALARVLKAQSEKEGTPAA